MNSSPMPANNIKEYFASIRLAGIALLILLLVQQFAVTRLVGAEAQKDRVSQGLFLKLNDRNLSGEVSGIYSLPGSLASGFNLHLFPDGAAVVERFSDLAPSYLVASGSWLLSDEKICITWGRWSPRDTLDNVKFPSRNRDKTEYTLYIRTRSSSLPEYFLCPFSETPDKTKELAFRIEKYLDWLEIKKSLEAETRGQAAEIAPPPSKPSQ